MFHTFKDQNSYLFQREISYMINRRFKGRWGSLRFVNIRWFEWTEKWLLTVEDRFHFYYQYSKELLFSMNYFYQFSTSIFPCSQQLVYFMQVIYLSSVIRNCTREQIIKHTWNYRRDLKAYINSYSGSLFCSIQS